MAQSESSSETTAQSSGPSIPIGLGADRDLTGSVLGDFEIERLLGRGGMGEVYLARQVSLNRHVAFKILRPDLSANPAYLTRFEAEASTAAKLNHANIVHIYSLGSIDGLRYISMEYVQGTNLRDYLAKKGSLDIPLALSIMRQTAQAVGAAGELGLIHRDIKPENLLLTRKGQVKVADFGLARDQGNPALHLTQPGVAMGTPMYMSPEQVQGHGLDHRSDLYSMGVTFYHMLAGQPPYRAETAVALALKHVRDTPVSPRVHRPDLPVEIERLVLKLMAKRPQDRYQSAAEMLRDLARIRESLQTSTAPAALSIETETLPDPPKAVAPVEPRVPLQARLSEFRIGAGLAATLVLIGLGAGLFYGYLGRSTDLLGEESPPPAGPPALWLAPTWTEVPPQPTPEAQYRYAQVHAAEAERDAAWLAVPGRFSNDREWATRAYTQVARSLFRRRDLERLRDLGAELARSSRTADTLLARVVAGGAHAIEGDFQGVLGDLNDVAFLESLVDPGMAELALEVAVYANRAGRAGAEPKGAMTDRLLELQRRCFFVLFGLGLREGGGRDRPGTP